MSVQSNDTLIKIDLITLQGVQNYGSVLQAFATQEFFESGGAQVRVINYVKEPNRWENLSHTWSGGNPLKSLAIAPTLKRWKMVFQGFSEEYLHLTNGPLTDDADFVDYDSNADAYCTGSDQVWNSVWNRGVLPPLYLSFAPPGSYKFAFGASFGQKRLSEDEIAATKDYIEQYRYISVREDDGLDILRYQYGYRDAIQTIDPTLCLTADAWRKHAKPMAIGGEYILIYNLNRSREFDDYAVALSKRTGLRLLRLCTRYDQFYRPGKSVFLPEVCEFVWLIDHAKYVLTDSFHATAFSMNMGTEPICVYPSEFSNRIASFLRLIKSEQRHVIGYDDFDVVNRPVDFSSVAAIIDAERRRAASYLSMVFEDVRTGRND